MRTGSLLGLSLGLPGVLLMACEAAVPARPAPPQPTITLDREDAAESTTSEPAKEDDAWLAMEHMLDGAATPRPSPSPDQQVAAAPANLQPYHALVLQTFPGDSNGEAAAVWRKQLGTLVPPLDPDLGVHTDSKGSIVIYGHYEGWEDPKVSEDMASLKGLRVNGKRIFGPIIRTTVRPQRNPEQIHPHELLSLRAKHPEVRTIYTLEIEVWGDFDSGT
ncbi:MAG: hypothetical protein QGG74_04090, partial [Phycisphaerales bacterium]|nr:hypothetical protein [Phycisphaerales bacterium]